MQQWSLITSSCMATVLVILLLSGILGNILVVLVTTRRRTRLLPGGVFIRSLAVVDAGGSANIIFMIVTVILRGDWVFGKVGCQISGTLIVFFGAISLHLLCIISINRYLKIARPALYNRVFDRTGTRILLVIPWILPMMMSLAPVFGWSAHDFYFSKSICHFYFSTSLSYTITFIVVVVLTPLGISGLCYVKMYCIVRQHSQSIRSSIHGRITPSSVEEIRSARIIFVLIVAFLMCYTPGSIINILEMADITVPPLLDLIAITLIVSKHSQNPVLYGLLNRRYRRELVKLLKSLTGGFCCQCFNVSEESEENTHRKFSGALSSIPQRTPSFRSTQNSWGASKGDGVRNSMRHSNNYPKVAVLYQPNVWNNCVLKYDWNSSVREHGANWNWMRIEGDIYPELEI